MFLQVLKNFFALWFWDSKPNLVRRLMRLLLTRQLMESMHPCGETYGQVRSSGVCFVDWFGSIGSVPVTGCSET